MKRTPAARLMGAQRRAFRLLALRGVLSMGAGAASAQEQPPAKPATQGEGAELAKKLSNPISDLVSAPFQFNWEQNVGPQKTPVESAAR